jgi:8-amino-7-oxononanoate synthase
MFYDTQLKALKRSNRFRERKIFDLELIDLASNDYLGLSKSKESLKKAYKILEESSHYSPRASMLVNGYSLIHKEFEEMLAKNNSFEDCILVGSGYLANIALVEALVRKQDLLFIDEEFHSSGILGSKLLDPKNVIKFKHNNPKDLEQKLKFSKARNKLILTEGIYSMSGDILKKEFFEIADKYNAILIVDEAHSSGVLGKKLLGIYDFYSILPKPNHIKMGTLGKAYGSYGAYILASKEIISYLINRAKPIIYSTALSLFDTALAKVNFESILQNSKILREKLDKRLEILKKEFKHKNSSLIVKIEFEKDYEVIKLQNKLIKKGFLVGAIRRPTVKKPILRVIPNLGVEEEKFLEFVKLSKEFKII